MEIRSPVGQSRRGRALATAMLVLGLSAAAGAGSALLRAERDATTSALALRTAGVRSALNTTLQRYADTVHDLVAAAATSRPTASTRPSPGWSTPGSPARTRSSWSPPTRP